MQKLVEVRDQVLVLLQYLHNSVSTSWLLRKAAVKVRGVGGKRGLLASKNEFCLTKLPAGWRNGVGAPAISPK